MKQSRDNKSKNSSKERSHKPSLINNVLLLSKIAKPIPISISTKFGLGTVGSARLKKA